MLAPLLRALAAWTALAFAAGAPAQTEQLRRQLAGVGVEERLGAVLPRHAVLAEEDGRPLSLAALGGRPALLSFNYTGCRRLCGLQLAGLARALREMGWRGEGFDVLTVSIDPAERLPQLRRYKESFVQQAGGGEGPARAWHFAAGDRGAIDALAEAAGFRYRYDPASGEFAHQATIVVLTGDGRVSGYLHGISYAPEALRTAVDRAGAGRVASAVEQRGLGGFLLACVGFDPTDPAPRALRIMRAGGAGALLFLVAFLGAHAVHGARKRRRERRDPTAA
jgi:protein SCO1/2